MNSYLSCNTEVAESVVLLPHHQFEVVKLFSVVYLLFQKS